MLKNLSPFLFIFLISCSEIDVNKEYKKGKASFENGEYAEAIDLLSDIIDETDTCFDCYLFRGHAYRKLELLDKARIDYNFIIKNGNDKAIMEAYVNRGGTYYDNAEYEKALSDYLKGLAYDPENGVIMNMVSHMYFFTNNKDSACYYYWESIATVNDTIQRDDTIPTTINL